MKYLSCLTGNTSLYNRQRPSIENHNQSKWRLVEPSSNRQSYKTLAPKAQETLQKKGWRYCKSQRTRKFAVSLCHLVMEEFILRNSHQPDWLNMNWTSQQKTSPSGWEKATGLNPTQRATGYWGKLRGRQTVFHREEHTNYLSSSKWSSLKMDIWITFYRLNMFYLVVCMCM